MATNADLVHQIEQAKRELKNKGWAHICSVMCDGETKNYGQVFTKNGQKFYLNIETMGEVWRLS